MPFRHEVIVRSSFRGLRYVDGRFVEVLEPGRYRLPMRKFPGQRLPRVEIVLVDVRERELNIKGQEILTADKVAVRVNIITHSGWSTRWRPSSGWPTMTTGSTVTSSSRRAVPSRR